MAERTVDTPHGAVTIEVDRAGLRDGNATLKSALGEAKAQAGKRRLTGEYGARVEGDKIVLVFPYAEAEE